MLGLVVLVGWTGPDCDGAGTTTPMSLWKRPGGRGASGGCLRRGVPTGTGVRVGTCIHCGAEPRPGALSVLSFAQPAPEVPVPPCASCLRGRAELNNSGTDWLREEARFLSANRRARRSAAPEAERRSTMFLVGLSGGIASGKSTVVAVLRELGCAVIDADVIAREVVQPHFKAYQQIVHYFGTEILLENGEINREALGNIIFSHPEKRQLLNSITHPEIQKEMLKQILKYFVLGYRYVILDIPLLFETNRLTKFMKHTVLVYCGGSCPSSDPQTQLSRLMKRNGLSQAEAEARIASQLPLDEKRRLASHIIDNSGDCESTRRQVLRLHARLEDSLDFLWARLAMGTAVAGLGGLVYFLLRHFIS
ncbi:dephospho-CoA kinase domain-containing protein isoform X3 [Struthio camelus]|uniref:dephospho-CoA kinase domain-containing protein isoform X3 n=1 Tax=Struthio camelus TaxID=8801 RepID=UPI003603DF45